TWSQHEAATRLDHADPRTDAAEERGARTRPVQRFADVEEQPGAPGGPGLRREMLQQPGAETAPPPRRDDEHVGEGVVGVVVLRQDHVRGPDHGRAVAHDPRTLPEPGPREPV